MRVLHIHTTDGRGGGSKIAYAVHSGLRDRFGVESRMIVRDSVRDDPTVTELRQLPGEDLLTAGIERVLSLEGLGSPSSFALQRTVRRDVDLIHLHNVHGRYFNWLNVPLFPDDVPIVWTCHDMWPFTGKCYMSYGCRRFETSCGRCPELDAPPPMAIDMTRLLRWLKERLFGRRPMTLAVPSAWMKELVDASFLADKPTHVIANGVDPSMFAPFPSDEARESFGISPKADVVLVVDPSKGVEDVLKGLCHAQETDTTLLVAGEGSITDNTVPDQIHIVHPGELSQSEMVRAYAAADVTAIPSRAESFGLVASESMACETPVVAYAAGGVAEQLTEDTGWTVQVGDAAALGARISEALDRPAERRRLGRAARTRIREEYAIQVTVRGYHRLYQSILSS